jgi:hypothetical protein
MSKTNDTSKLATLEDQGTLADDGMTTELTIDELDAVSSGIVATKQGPSGYPGGRRSKPGFEVFG